MEAYQIIVIGNGEPALVCTISAINTYTDKSIAVIKNDKNDSLIEKILSATYGGSNNRLNVFYDEVSYKSNNTLILSSGKKLQYEKLVLATGSYAIEPPIEGIRKKGVVLINKDPKSLRIIRQKALEAQNIVIYGGRYIGVELTDELLKLGKKVTLIEKSKRLMPSSFDSETSVKAKEIIENLEGKVILDTKIKEIQGNDYVTGLSLNNNEIVDCDFLLLCCGTRPNTAIAEKLGLIFDRDRGILVDEYFRTSDKDIFAVGECAAEHDFFSSDLANVFLHNAKLEEAKLLGKNLYSIIFNRGRMLDYLTNNKNIKQKVRKVFKIHRSSNDTKDHISLHGVQN